MQDHASGSMSGSCWDQAEGSTSLDLQYNLCNDGHPLWPERRGNYGHGFSQKLRLETSRAKCSYLRIGSRLAPPVVQCKGKFVVSVVALFQASRLSVFQRYTRLRSSRRTEPYHRRENKMTSRSHIEGLPVELVLNFLQTSLRSCRRP